MTFFLGTHQPHWLALTDAALCVSRRRLADVKRLPRAVSPWLLDSGGFTELSLSGAWETSAETYVADARRYAAEVGQLVGAACQDWMCEPGMLGKTGLGVAEHQRRTVESILTLRALAPDVPWFPILQGWQPADYLRHVEQYQQAGVDLLAEPLVGVGSVCRRQHAGVLEDVIEPLAALGLRLHGFGVKLTGLDAVAPLLASADSMAWSFAARRAAPLPGCAHASCANCLRYALRWRAGLLSRLAVARPRQLRLEFV